MKRKAWVLAALGCCLAPFAQLRAQTTAGHMVADPYITAPGHDDARAQALAILIANPQNLTHRDMAKPGPDTRSYLPGIKAKTLILVGDHDAPDLQAWAGAAEVLMPDAKRQVVTDAGHMLNLEQPQAFVDAVEAFVG